MSPEMLSALGSVGSAAGGLFQAGASMFGQANAQDYASNEAEINRRWQYHMWQLQNDYNTPLNQRKRLEAAGLNPYLMLNGGNAGQAQTAPQGNMAAAPGIPTFQNPLQGASDAMMQLFNLSQQKEAARGAKIDNETRSVLNIAKLNQILADTDDKKMHRVLQDFQRGLLAEQIQFNWGTHESRIENTFYDSLLKKSQAETQQEMVTSVALDNALKSVEYSYLDAKEKAQIKSFLATAAQAHAQAQFALAQAQETKERTHALYGEGGYQYYVNKRAKFDAQTSFWNSGVARKQYYSMPSNVRKVANLALETMQATYDKLQSESFRNYMSPLGGNIGFDLNSWLNQKDKNGNSPASPNFDPYNGYKNNPRSLRYKPHLYLK